MATEVQTTYSDTAGVAYAGMLSDAEPSRVFSFENADAAAMLSGTFAAKLAATPELKARTLAAVTDPIAGIILHSHARNNVLGQAGWEVGGEMPLLERGAAYMVAEVTLVVGDPVFVRFATGTGTQIGAIRKDHDSNTCMLIRGARIVAGGGTTTPPAVYFDKLVQETPGDLVEIGFSHVGAIAATTTVGVIQTKADRHFVVDEVVYDNPTGYVQDATNYYILSVQRGATVIAQWSLLTGAQGTIAADTFVTFVNQALANRVVPPATRLDFKLTKVAAGANVPAGSGFIRGRYL